MINWDKIDKKINVNKVILPILIITFIVLLFTYVVIIKKHIQNSIFADEMEWISKKNENPDFRIEKIYLCSSANAIEKSKNLNDLNLYQFTDIAIYLNNDKDGGLTKRNTVKNLYIDGIDLQLENDTSKASLVYTNLLKIGSREELKNMIFNSKNEQNEKIDFNIINTNEQNSNANYENPTFYADCSNPISLKYINEINKDYSIGKDNSAVFDGTILKKAGIKIEDINAKVRFKINLINNNDEYYSAWVNFKIPLSDIYNGTSIKSKNTVGQEYNFFSI